MALDNWQQVREIFDVALQQKPEERSMFLNEVCAGDETLLTEVESLLTSFDSAETFLEQPAIAKIAEQALAERRQFSQGQFLNHYKIIRSIGTGGMGEVYLATDTKLNRQVALKVLHPNLLSDNQANGRLLREAQAAALLDHPHICAIHEISDSDEGSFIVMQYVEGETLADVLAKPLSVDKALDLAIQIAEALVEAHAHRIIHRDIKPANIIVNERWQAKVLDFGLAKFIETESLQDTVERLHSSGSVMGTVPYMSPEQLCGKSLDARTDIFSFGAMFYEMLCGQQAFAKESNAETISAILNDQPDWSRIPARLQPIVQKSLKKELGERYQTAQDITLDLRKAQQSGEFLLETDSESSETSKAETISTSSFKRFFARETAGSKIPSYRFWRSSSPSVQSAPETDPLGNEQTIKSKTFRPGYPAIFAAVTIFLILGAAGWLVWQTNKADDIHAFDNLRSVRLVSWKTGASTLSGDYRVSHNGKMVAYSSTQEGPTEAIFVKQTTDGAEIRVTKDGWNNETPIWSPDDQKIAFASGRKGQSGIYSIPAFGGNATPLKILGNSDSGVFLRHWSKDGTAIFYEFETNLFRLDIATQEVTQITNFVKNRMRYFCVSPDESKIVYVDHTDGQPDLWMSPITNVSPVSLTDDKEGEIRPRWHPDGERILYTVLRNNYYQINVAFTDERPPRQVIRGDSDYKIFDISGDGSEIYYLSQERKSDIWGLRTKTGEEFEMASGVESEYWTDVSPDGQSIVYQSNSSVLADILAENSSIIVKSLTNQFPPLSFKGLNPRWLPDNRRIAFQRSAETRKKYDLWVVDTINGEEKQVANVSVGGPTYALLPYNRSQAREYTWSPDSSNVAYLNSESGIQNILSTSIDSNDTVNFTNNDNPNLWFYCPLYSPDGKRIAFVSEQRPASKEEKIIWKIWVIEKGRPKEIYSGTASLRLLGWSADGGLVLEKSEAVMAANPMDISLLRISTTGKKQFETIFKQIYVTSMSLSADGKMMGFTARQDNKDNICVASTKSGELKRMTNNSNPKLFYGSPALSPDGNTIFFDKQEETSIISRLENFN